MPMRQNGCAAATKRVIICDKTGARLRRSGCGLLLLQQKGIGIAECDKTGAFGPATAIAIDVPVCALRQKGCIRDATRIRGVSQRRA
jgi:hypothetical protein